jgi:hypothetical protein
MKRLCVLSWRTDSGVNNLSLSRLIGPGVFEPDEVLVLRQNLT